ncbi:slx4p [Saccharomyces arboricola H-6]|uniref:Structure-specific endonuclease subunit SLX4 n=1 Tax=Saccharomyces arboricola (strain H-6 / AS 2.3317 / CBS 10644) TaxID=1160507 RepID=J8Q563_SACAR|nr:slx4p [Saccharomyces arboricola H-6]
MEFQRAQRNLKLLQSEDSTNATNHMNGDSQRVSSVTIETQVPDVQFSLSSDDDSMNSQEKNETIQITSEAKETTIRDAESSKYAIAINANSTNISPCNLQGPDTTEENIFINTQIQSRLDDAEEETNLKSKLKQFKYASKSKNSYQTPYASVPAKRRPAIRKAKPKLKSKARSERDPNIIKNITEFNISNYERLRTASLLKQLSGKHKKVLDIIKVQKDGCNSLSSKIKTCKGERATFDTYNEQEWKYISKLLLERFPHSETTDLNEVQKFLYGCEQSPGALDDSKVPEKTLWTASQLPPELSDKTIQSEQEQGAQNTQSTVKYLSLSQVMDDKSEIINDDEDVVISEEFSTSSQEYGCKSVGPKTSKHVIDKNIELTVGTHMHGFALTDYKTDEPLIVEGHEDNDHDDVSIVSDTTDETSTLFPLDPYRFVFIEDNEKPALTTDTIGSTQFFTPNTSPLDGIIDLTQESFKAVRSLISPLKMESNKAAASQASNQVQVPATRTSTVIPHKDLISTLKTEEERIDEEKFIRVKLLSETVNKLDPEIVKYNCYEFEANDSQAEEETDCDNRFCIIDVELADSPKTFVETPIPNLATSNNVNNTATASPTTSPEKFHETITSQSMKELRQSLKTVGLKPMKTKVEIIQSLQTASQILFVATPCDSDEHDGVIGFSKMEVFDHLTELIQYFPDLLERIYTFEPIPLNEVIEKLFSIEPFVLQIDEATIREWADIQGICLRNDKK